MRTFRHYGLIKNGVKVYSNPELLQISIAELEGKEFEEIIQKKKVNASRSQYGYLFGGVFGEALLDETYAGWEEKEIEQFFAGQFLSYWYEKTIRLPNGNTMPKIIHCTGSFKGIDKDKMTEVIEKIIRYLAGQGIVVKTPEEYHYGKFQQISKRS